MKSPTPVLVILISLVVFLVGCYGARVSKESASSSARRTELQSTDLVPEQEQQIKPIQPVSLSDADKAKSATGAFDRKIIRDANLILEVNSPTDAFRQVSSIAEAHGGFVVTSESKQREASEPANRQLDIKLVARIPSNQFDAAISSVEKLANNVIQRNVKGQDVTEEFIDLEARIKTQQALELQFLQIMKQATKVADAMEVQRQIADVRTEIEKLEGRKRFLENNATLSTITISLQSPMPIAVNTSGFGRSIREAVSESIETASAIVLGLIRLVIVMFPIFVFVLLPAGLSARYLVRRAKRIRLAAALHATPSSD